MSTARFSDEMARDRIDRMLEQARAPHIQSAGPRFPRLAAMLRRAADRIDASCTEALRERPMPTR